MARKSFVGEYIDYLKKSKKWWLAPVMAVVGLLGVLVVLGGTSAAPFIYTLF